MKKFFAIALSTLLLASFAACSASAPSSEAEAVEEESVEATGAELEDESEEKAEEAGGTITITSLNAEKEEVQIEVPYDPARVAVMDLAVLDMIDNYGLGERVVGVSKSSSIDYLSAYTENDDIVNLGTIKEASLEAVMECEPDIIFIGGRLASQYDAFAEIAPVVFLSTDSEIGLVQSVNKNALTVASIFGVEDMVSDLLADFDARIEALAAAADGQTAFVGMLNAGSFNALGNDGRCSIIGVEVGFENIGIEAVTERSGGEGRGGAEGGEGNGEAREAEGENGARGGAEAAEGEGGRGGSEGGSDATSAHGNETSFEFIVEKDPDFIFVMNRDDAIGTEGTDSAQEVIENELVMRTSAYQNGNIVYLQYSNIWYTAEGGITALDYMLRDLEAALLG